MCTLLMTITPANRSGGRWAGRSAAALEAARAGLTVHLYDERPILGGPTYGRAAESKLLAKLEAAGSRGVLHQRATIWGIFEQRTLAVWERDRAESVRPEAMVLATGAHDRAVPVPGWTLPGVTNAEAIRSLLDARALPPGQRVLGRNGALASRRGQPPRPRGRSRSGRAGRRSFAPDAASIANIVGSMAAFR